MIEVGMYYQRDSKGRISLCKKGNLTPDEYVERNKGIYDIKKASYNLIDLIEEEDLIKYKDNIIYHIGASYSTENKEKGFRKCIFTFEGERLFLDEMKVEEDIKSIVTKEQFKSAEYEVKE